VKPTVASAKLSFRYLLCLSIMPITGTRVYISFCERYIVSAYQIQFSAAHGPKSISHGIRNRATEDVRV
jgi:hypothetical protein